MPGIIAILFLALFLVFATVLLSAFLRQRTRLREWKAVLDGLDQKYLFTECTSPPRGLYERRLFDLTRQAERSMVGTVSDALAGFSLALFFLIYAVYILLAYTSLERNVIPD